jgi:hypothetical protein
VLALLALQRFDAARRRLLLDIDLLTGSTATANIAASLSLGAKSISDSTWHWHKSKLESNLASLCVQLVTGQCRTVLAAIDHIAENWDKTVNKYYSRVRCDPQNRSFSSKNPRGTNRA